MRLFVARSGLPFALIALIGIAGCTSSGRAPVEDRTAPSRPAAGAPAQDAAPAVARPGYYIVKRGDTLISIALSMVRTGVTLPTGNAIENPNLILVGQELRVKPADGTAAKPVVSTDDRIQTIGAKTTAAAPSGKADESLRRDPKGWKGRLLGSGACSRREG